MIKDGSRSNVPALRFPEFENSWIIKFLPDLGDLKNGFNADKNAFGSGVHFVNLMDIFGRNEIKTTSLGRVEASEGEIEKYSIKRGDVLFVRSSVKREGVGEACLVNHHYKDTIYSGFIIRFRPNSNELKHLYKKYCFSTDSVRRQILAFATTNANTNINQESLGKVTIIFPSIPEQRKIAAFLGAVDAKLDALRRKRALLAEYKRGVMQKLFSQQIRFTQDDGTPFPDWEVKKLGQLAKRQTAKNTNDSISRVLTNSATQGVVDQTAYFDKNIANANNLMGYYIIEKGDYVYNPRISVHAPVGPIKKNHLGQGVMSPLYTVFRFDSDHNELYEQYFQTTHWHKYMSSVANYGARHDRMNITIADFLALPLPVPVTEEQQKIANFLTTVNDKIAAVDQQITHIETFKKGLLQQMFV
jgi:type I restriction enzyme S subunit